MDRNGIIAELWSSPDLNQALSNMKPVEMQEDLKSELFLIICEIDESKLIDLYDKKQLKFYIVRIMLNLVQSFDQRIRIRSTYRTNSVQFNWLQEA